MAKYLDKNGHVYEVLSVKLIKGGQELQPVAFRVHLDRDLAAVLGWGLEGVHAGVETFGGQLITIGALQLELAS